MYGRDNIFGLSGLQGLVDLGIQAAAPEQVPPSASAHRQGSARQLTCPFPLLRRLVPLQLPVLASAPQQVILRITKTLIL